MPNAGSELLQHFLLLHFGHLTYFFKLITDKTVQEILKIVVIITFQLLSAIAIQISPHLELLYLKGKCSLSETEILSS